jgi:hypothetical protein
MTQRRVIFAIPAYDFTAHLDTIGSIIVAGEKLRMAGIQWGLIYQGGSSIVSRARNSLVDGFLEMEEATDLVFIDSDIVFDADELLTLIHWGETKDIVCGAYPIKREDVTRFPIHVKMNDQGGAIFDQENKRLLQVTGCGGGFLLIKRNVFETMKEKLDIPMCKDAVRGETATFFHFAIEGDQYVGEDIYFCRKAIEAGFDIWCDPYLTLTHVGMKNYTGRLVDHFEVIREGDGKLKEIA